MSVLARLRCRWFGHGAPYSRVHQAYRLRLTVIRCSRCHAMVAPARRYIGQYPKTRSLA